MPVLSRLSFTNIAIPKKVRKADTNASEPSVSWPATESQTLRDVSSIINHSSVSSFAYCMFTVHINSKILNLYFNKISGIDISKL